MAKLRWLFLWLALVCGLGMFAVPLTPSLRDLVPHNSSDAVMTVFFLGAAALQTLGALGMRTHLRENAGSAPVAIGLSFGSAIAWIIALPGSSAAVAAGPGGLPIAFLLVFPAVLIAIVLQITTLIMFGNAERKAVAG